MRIVHIAPGAGGMYCGMCIRESTLVTALRAEGQDVTLIPAYTPLRTDDEDSSVGALFFGGINVYLQQRTSVFRHTPRWVDRLFDSRWLVCWATRTSAKANPDFLGQLTASMLAGEDGRQRKELDRLVRALKEQIRPDLVVLTTALLAGMARRIKTELSVPVLLGLQGEDVFLDELPAKHRERCLALLRERVMEADGFVSISHYYAATAVERFGIDPGRVHVVLSGINTEGYGSPAQPPEVFTVGYLSRIVPEKGLHLLVRAFASLRERAGARRCRLRIAGGVSDSDRSYLNDVQTQVQAAGFADDFEYVGELDRQEKLRFLQSLSVFSVPTIYRDPRGLAVLEALASGVPVVQPNHGVFRELVEATRGGLLVRAHDPDDLAAGLHRLMEDETLRQRLGEQGRTAVFERFTASAMARATLDAYHVYFRRAQ